MKFNADKVGYYLFVGGLVMLAVMFVISNM